MAKHKADRKNPKKGNSDFMHQFPAEHVSILRQNKICVKATKGNPYIFCKICKRQIDSVPLAVTHTLEPTHLQAKEVNHLQSLLTCLPPITDAHRSSLNTSLQSVNIDQLDDFETERRLNFARQICEALESRIEGLTMCVIGSILTGLSLHSSDVNLDAFLEPVKVDNENSNAIETGLISSLNPYDKGFSSALPEIFSIFCSVDTQKTHSNKLGFRNGILPALPNFETVRKSYESGNYSVIVEDSKLVRYCITVGNPRGREFAALIRTYLSVDNRAKSLMIILLKFAQLAHLHKLPKPALYILVIFFLQNISPPVLPNLHEIVHRHRKELPLKSIEEVVTEEGDFSYLKDLSLLPQFYSPHNTMTIADIWLKFLRFYVFEFQYRSCVISITRYDPIPKPQKVASSELWVEHPFSPSVSLTKGLMLSAEKYIQDQFVAAYSYFGIPRLSETGRPLFTNVLVERTIKKERQKDANILKGFPLNRIFFDELDLHLNKVASLFVASFDQTATSNVNIAENNKPKVSEQLLDLGVVVPKVLHLAYSEVCQSGHVEDIENFCLRRVSHVLSANSGFKLNLSLATQFLRTYCRNLWLDVRPMYENGAKYLRKGRLIGIGEKALKMTLRAMVPGDVFPFLESESDSHVVNEDEHTTSISHENFDCTPFMTDKPDLFSEEVENMRPSSQEEVETDMGIHRFDDLGPNSEENDDGDRGEDSPNSIAPSLEDANHPGGTRNLWRKYIKNSDDSFIILDSDNPDYYNSAKANSLKPEDLSFPFIIRSAYDSNAPFSIFGSASSNQPSSMVAHRLKPVPFCAFCGISGHCAKTCVSGPEVSIGMVSWAKLKRDLPKVSNQVHLQELSVCLIQLSDFHASRGTMNFRQNIVAALTELFRPTYPDISLKLFGSCANGFETESSDLDICIMFPPNSPQISSLLDPKRRLTLLKTFTTLLNKNSKNFGISNIRPVYFAKVPIIKFTVGNYFEVDLSFSNFLAVKNTEMLCFYNKIDSRLRVLNIALKIVLKAYNLPKSDAGGISSYAFAIMLIHYLQQKGFLPVLQELYEGPEKPVVNVGDWNVWYQNDMEMVRKLWKPPEKDVTVAELWLGFLRYYLFEFDREIYVVTIKQNALLDRLGKLWDSLLAIEDPFNLCHNLTNSVCRKVLLQVLTSLYNVLLLHTTSIRKQMNMDYWKYSLFATQNNQGSVIKTNRRNNRDFNNAHSPPFTHHDGIATAIVPSNATPNHPIRATLSSNDPGARRAAARMPGPSNRARAPYHRQQQQRERTQEVASGPSRGGNFAHRGAPFGRGARARGGTNRSRGRGERRNP